MLERVLEAEVMDSRDEAVDYDSMDHREVNRVFAGDFLHVWQAAASQRGPADDDSDDPPPLILDLGTGTAQIPVEVCRQCAASDAGLRFRILAVDAAANMLDLARLNVEVAGFRREIRLEQVDAKRLPYPHGQFAAVVSNSIVHHIPAPREALAEAVRVTAVGGLLFFRDLLRPADREELNRLVALYAGGANEHQQKMFADSLHAALSLEEMRALVAEFGFAPDTVSQTTDRHWTWSAMKGS